METYVMRFDIDLCVKTIIIINEKQQNVIAPSDGMYLQNM